MYALIVNIDVKPEFVEEFMAVTLENARAFARGEELKNEVKA